MKLAYWMYAGPAHIGTLRVASSFKNVHSIMHAPLGDDYFNVMRSMLERERDFTPVTTSIVDRHVLARGSQEKVVENIMRKDNEESPDLILLTPTCTSSILQEDLQNFVNRASMSDSSTCDVILADVNHYRVNELQAADRTLEQIVRFYLEKERNCGPEGQLGAPPPALPASWPGKAGPLGAEAPAKDKVTAENNVDLAMPNSDGYSSQQKHINIGIKTERPSANIIGIFTLGFHNQHDCRELKRLLNNLGIDVNEVIPEGGSVKNLKNLPKAWFNLVPYREVGLMTAIYLEKEFQMPYVSITPMGLIDTAICIREIENILNKIELARREATRIPAPKAGTPTTGEAQTQPQPIMVKTSNSTEKFFDFETYIENQTRFVSQAAWFSRSIDCQNLTGKKAVVFGDATHAAAMTKILTREMGINVVCSGTYCKHDSDWFREQVMGFCNQILITDDHTQVSDMIAKLEPSAIFGTQMERHIGKRLEIPCGVISAPVHIQNFPLSYRPFLGYEGTNQIADLVYNSFSLGMEDHLLEIFSGHDTKEVVTKTLSTEIAGRSAPSGGAEPHQDLKWDSDALKELSKIPGFVRGKVQRNTEKYAQQNSIKLITLDVLFAAKEAFSR